jgi:hypothetical protein
VLIVIMSTRVWGADCQYPGGGFHARRVREAEVHEDEVGSQIDDELDRVCVTSIHAMSK